MSRESRPPSSNPASLRRYVRSAGLVVGGAAWGAALMWLATRPPDPPGSSVASMTSGAAIAELVRGAAQPEAEAPRGAMASAQAQVSTAALDVLPSDLQDAYGHRRPDIVRGAQRALQYAVHLEGGGGYGAGFLVDVDGHVLTCHHVVEGLSEVEVKLAGGASTVARVVARDALLDLALLRVVDGMPDGAEPASLGSVTEVALGQTVYSMGSPRGMPFSLGAGMVSFVGRRFDGVSFLQTELALNGGSSGGPVFDADGRVVAVSSFVLRDSEGLAYALPIDYALRRFENELALEPRDASSFDAWRKAHTAPEARSGLIRASKPR